MTLKKLLSRRARKITAGEGSSTTPPVEFDLMDTAFLLRNINAALK